MSIIKHNYILIDYENVQSLALDRLESLPVSVAIFVGKNQKSIPMDLFRTACAFTGSLVVIESVASGKNALDFQMACYAGVLSERDPQAYIHFVTKDKGFDVVVAFLKSQKRMSARSDSFMELGVFKKGEDYKAYSEQMRHDHVIERFGKIVSRSRPQKVKTMMTTLNAMFGRQLDQDDLQKVYQGLISKKVISVGEGGRMIHHLADPKAAKPVKDEVKVMAAKKSEPCKELPSKEKGEASKNKGVVLTQ